MTASLTQMSNVTDYSLHTGPVHEKILHFKLLAFECIILLQPFVTRCSCPQLIYFFLFFLTFFFFQKEAIQNKIKLDNAKAITAAKPPVVLVQPVTESVFLTELS